MVDAHRLILIRHAMPEIDPQVPAERWHLGDEGRAAARSLRPLVAQPAYYVASTEPKAVETLQEIAGDLDVHLDSGFAEVGRPHFWRDDDDYRALAGAYVDGVRHEGWEAHNQVIHRFDVAVARHAGIAAARHSTVVIGTHGLAPTIWLASRCSLRPSPTQFWQALRFPDVIEVDLTSGTVSRV
jgi:broad specificity phosphatase PhoE